MWKKIIIILTLILLFFTNKFLLIFLIPGVFLIQKKKLLSQVFVQGIALSLGFWILSFWYLKFVPVSLTGLFYFVFVLTVIGLMIKDVKVKVNKTELIVVTCLLLLSLIRFMPFFNNYFPAGADMSFHTLNAKIITLNKGFPETFDPVNPLKFGGYPVGFSIISSYVSLLSNMPVYKATLFVANFCYAFLILSLYFFLRKYFNQKIALITSFISVFIANNPQFFIAWGGNPFVLSLCFLFMAVYFIKPVNKFTKPDIVFFTVFACASLFTHVIPVYTFFYVYLPLFLINNFKIIKSKKSFHNLITIAIIFVIFLLPYIIHYDFNISDSEIQWQRQRNAEKFLTWKGDITNFFSTGLHLINLLFGRNYLVLLAAGLVFLIKNNNLLKEVIIMVGSCSLVIINSKYWILPFSYVLLSERVAVLLLIPFSIAIGHMIYQVVDKKLLDKLIDNKLASKLMILVVFVLLLFFARMQVQYYYRVSEAFGMVTPEDLEAFEWIKQNTYQDSLFLNNYGDAGLWIAPLTLRKTRTVHTSPVYFDETEEYLSSLEPDYVYFGKKQVYDINLDYKEYESNEIVYDHGGVIILKII